MEVRYAVACNINCPTHILEKLSKDEDEDVRNAAKRKLLSKKANINYRLYSFAKLINYKYN